MVRKCKDWIAMYKSMRNLTLQKSKYWGIVRWSSFRVDEFNSPFGLHHNSGKVGFISLLDRIGVSTVLTLKPCSYFIMIALHHSKSWPLPLACLEFLHSYLFVQLSPIFKCSCQRSTASHDSKISASATGQGNV